MKKISKITKRDIFDGLINGFNYRKVIPNSDGYYAEITYKLSLYGRLDEIDFLYRLYNLKQMESYDSRYMNAYDDIWQHTINNDDYEAFWVFEDPRFELIDGEDLILLNFISEIFHPEVRLENEPWKFFLKKINELLKYDGYELYEIHKISGRSVYSSRAINDNLIMENQIVNIKNEFNSEYITSQVEFMSENINIASNIAIGKAKELLESCCKTILDKYNETYTNNDNINQLMKKTCDVLNLNATKLSKDIKGREISAKILGNLSNITQGMAELRNIYGDGHGKNKDFKTLPPRYANLAVGTSVAAVNFLWDTYKERNKNET